MTNPSVISRRKRRPDARPAEILAAALDLFTERGFQATRLEDVARRAGLSKAAIYLYFKDKTALLKAIVEATATANITTAAELIDRHRGPAAPVICELLELLATRMTETRLPDLMKLIISEARAHPDVGRFYLENVMGRALPLFRGLIERGIASGEFREVDADLTVKCLIGPMLLGGIWRSAFEPIGAPPIDLVALARQDADFIIRGLRP
jgi:AcrR family transcriptional regulator